LLEKLFSEMKDAANASEMEAYLEKNHEFHRTIYLSTGQPLLCEIIEDLWFRVSPYMYLYLLRENVKNHDTYHLQLLQALREHDPDDACRWLRLHLRKSLQELTAQLKEREQELSSESRTG
jgi:DNA-binding GntR family transcriptional regulator